MRAAPRSTRLIQSAMLNSRIDECDGQSFNLMLQALLLDGRIILRTYKEEEEEQKGKGNPSPAIRSRKGRVHDPT